MSRRSRGVVGAWAEAQRQQQLRAQAAHRAWVQQQREQERQRRSWEREQARTERERQAAYRRGREAGARRLTEELDARVAELSGLLAAGCDAPVFRAEALMKAEDIEPFHPGALGEPVPMPEPGWYRTQRDGWTFRAGRRAQAEADAQARFERDWHAAQAAEAERQRKLADYQRQYDHWAQAQLAEVRQHNEGVRRLREGLGRGDADAVVEFFSAALYAAAAWPDDFPRRVEASFDTAGRRLVLDWELPKYAVVPGTKAVRYVASADEERETARPAAQRRVLYRDVLAQSMLLVLRDLFTADATGALRSVVLNGFVDDHDPVTGRRTQLVLATATVPRASFEELDLARVNAVDCLVDGLGGRLSARPDQYAPVPPGPRPADAGQGVVSLGDDAPDLLEMDPVEFERLVAALFRARGMQAVMTQRSNDGGVDVEALDPDPVSGGRIIVQVKRYRATVPPGAVRDLYGTVQSAGANKGILVTTSGFGPGSYTFANGKPLTLISGAELVQLLGQAGLPGRLGGGPARAPGAQRPPARRESEEHVLGMAWDGAVALDVCALVCQGQRALSDDHFVFYNNSRTPEGTLRAVAASPPDRAALRVAFDALPERADRLVLAAAIDPAADPDADLSGFTGARIRLADSAGTELGLLEVSDGRPGETALVLGSFRRRAGGDWSFVAGGKGYPGGLADLISDYGIDTE
ncbi:restriction endonuclease [Streptomyces sp. MP131-18]|uniref:restriction endonuclease n=1 Tax=Streptomyces sp. MP131-18 TaxID=1857892 RepID=UPI00097C4132|nr:restriction endonuclease [Streptomyces sp. MP131-18]ONK12966.1 General stress protein 16U [Streptomyces sp. MP131-18]